MHKISLRNDAYAVDILPALGGAISSFRACAANGEEFDLLAPADNVADDTNTRFAAQPRLPFITQTAALQANGGNIANNPWTVQDASDVRATLTCYFPPMTTEHPWEFQLLQRIVIQPEGLQIYLALTNIGKQPIPARLGMALRLQPSAEIRFGGIANLPDALPCWVGLAAPNCHGEIGCPSCPFDLAIETDASLSALWLETADCAPTPKSAPQAVAGAGPAMLAQADSCAGQLQLSARLKTAGR